MTQWRKCSEFNLANMPPTAAESVRTWQWSELLAAKEAACGTNYGAFWVDWPPAVQEAAVKEWNRDEHPN